MKTIDALLTVALIVLAGLTALTLGPVVETRFFPVYSKFRINTLVETPDGGSAVTFAFTKLRDCQPAGINWFIGEPGGAYRQIELLSTRPTGGPPVNRPLGDHISNIYTIDVAPDVLRDQGFASIYSNCHPFWVTRSVIYP